MQSAIAEKLELKPQVFPKPQLELIYGGGETSSPKGNLHEAGSEAQSIVAAEMPGAAERLQQAQKNLTARKVGDIALTEVVEVKEKPIINIRESALWAKKGDQEGKQNLRINVQSEMIEQLFKAGNVTSKKRLHRDKDGNIYQYGQRMDDTHRNAYQLASNHEVIRSRTVAEAENGAHIKHGVDIGLTKTHNFVVFSMCAEGLSDEELDKLNFFSLTKSMSIQSTGEDQEGLYMEAAFYAGVKNEKSERHDRQAVEAVGDDLGIDFRNKSAAEIISLGAWVPKTKMPNGVVDVVKMLDDKVESEVFFGQDEPVQDYVQSKDFCIDREANFDDRVEAITDQIISEVKSLPTSVSVSKRLAKLVQQALVLKAINDTSIDSRIFGKESSQSIISARDAVARGMHEQALTFQVHALKTAVSGSCPTSFESLAKQLGLPESVVEAVKKEKNPDKDDAGDGKGPLRFKCRKGHWNRRELGSLLTECRVKDCSPDSVGC